MAEDSFRNLFRERQRLIQTADAAVAEASRIIASTTADPDKRDIDAAAKQCEKAAALYLKAGLGLLAKEQYVAASYFYTLCGDNERARLTHEQWAAVPTYWERDDDRCYQAPRDHKDSHDG